MPQDDPNADELYVSNLADVKFQNVTFGYEAKRGPILKGLNLNIGAGMKVAVVGSSGAGKSTIARLLYRLYDVDGGAVLINGQDIRKCTQRSVRLVVGIVPQDCVLFNDTIVYNIGFGKLAKGELASEEEVVKASAAAQLTDFVRTQPLGYQTVVGERGLRLSGGEKQRVAIARALLKAPPIMVFDEATSALDSKTEMEIQTALSLAAKGRTNLTIAHRLSTLVDSGAWGSRTGPCLCTLLLASRATFIQIPDQFAAAEMRPRLTALFLGPLFSPAPGRADLIAVLDVGVVAESGTHFELIALGGLYASMWAKQQDAANRGESSADLTALGKEAGASALARGGGGGGGPVGPGGLRVPMPAVTAPAGPPAPAPPSLI